MKDIVSHIPGTSADEMLEYCERLLRVASQQYDVKVGIGKSAETITKYKYSDAESIIQKMTHSIKHYSAMSSVFKLRDYQEAIVNSAVEVLEQYGFVYLAMEVRTGKTLTALATIEEFSGINYALFVTKKKAISSIELDYCKKSRPYHLTVINYESLHLVKDSHPWDFIILDEAHSLGAFPKPSDRAIMVKDIMSSLPKAPYVILLSGTPTPESYSQMYHQVYGMPNNPFNSYTNFYRFCDDYVKLKHKKINGYMVRDYSEGYEKIIDDMSKYMIKFSQSDAGFSTSIEEEILTVRLKESTYKMIKKLSSDKVLQGKNEVILADTSVKMMMKQHQMYSGTVKFESGNSMVIDTSKAEFIKQRFAGKKIGIFYKFKEELSALQSVFKDDLTTDLSVFDDTSKSIALQIVSGREGISLRKAEFLVYYNIDFSATSYWQSRDRMTTMDRLSNKVYWVFSENGIEIDIYKAVSKKMDYTVNHFKKDRK